MREEGVQADFEGQAHGLTVLVMASQSVLRRSGWRFKMAPKGHAGFCFFGRCWLWFKDATYQVSFHGAFHGSLAANIFKRAVLA